MSIRKESPGRWASGFHHEQLMLKEKNTSRNARSVCCIELHSADPSKAGNWGEKRRKTVGGAKFALVWFQSGPESLCVF